MKSIILIIVIPLLFIIKNQDLKAQEDQYKYQQLIFDLISSDWAKVYKAKDSLISIRKPAIPDLIRLLDDTKAYEKLENTTDLIYPGKGEFIFNGSGWIVDYDLNWIAIRAGWTLEDLTMEDFGFKENLLIQEKLNELYNNHKAEILENGNCKVNFEGTKYKELDNIIMKVSVWWREKESDWTFLIGLKNAIYSDDTNRQLMAIRQMLNYRFKIDGGNKEWFNQEIEDRIIELNKSDNEELKLETEMLLQKLKYEMPTLNKPH
jgi:hypothetical protein